MITGCSKSRSEIEYSPGVKVNYSADRVSFNMVYVPAKIFKTGTDDLKTAEVEDSFWIGESEVSYELWEKVYLWATQGRSGTGAGEYVFTTPGRQGGAMGTGAVGTNQHPVTSITWRDAMIWCNALTEWYNFRSRSEYSCVYYTDPGFLRPIRSVNDSTEITFEISGSQDAPYVRPGATGFRLPSSKEWELAARYIIDKNNDGDITDNNEYYPGSYASGASDSYRNFQATSEVAIQSTTSTAGVKSRSPNALGIYDMSGNAWEWCFDWHPLFFGSNRIKRGGSWLDFSTYLQLGIVSYYKPCYEYYYIGFRVAMSLE
jgi:formylglycine-generating enzyme required for sulfatase activity